MEDLPGRGNALCPSGEREADQETPSPHSSASLQVRGRPSRSLGPSSPPVAHWLLAWPRLDYLDYVIKEIYPTPWFGCNFPGDSNCRRPRTQCPQWTSAQRTWTRGSCCSTGSLASEFSVSSSDRHSRLPVPPAGPRGCWRGRVPRRASGPLVAVSRLPEEPSFCIPDLLRN